MYEKKVGKKTSIIGLSKIYTFIKGADSRSFFICILKKSDKKLLLYPVCAGTKAPHNQKTF